MLRNASRSYPVLELSAMPGMFRNSGLSCRGTKSSNPSPSSGESGANSRLPPGVQAVIVILGNHEFAAKSVPSAAPTAADHRGGSESLLKCQERTSIVAIIMCCLLFLNSALPG